ncbi:MAG: hypothetical protein H0X30_29660 [Anaerolineae bacterium]|nr:hypothetical protein [Anaerolineae bacterium]
MNKQDFQNGVSELQQFIGTSFALHHVLWQPTVPLVVEELTDGSIFGEVAELDKDGAVISEGILTSKLKVETLLNKEFGGPGASRSEGSGAAIRDRHGV